MATTTPPKRAAAGFGNVPAGPRRVGIYLRRSTDDEHQAFSIGAQETALGSYVTTQPGWTLTATFTDDASGATTDRPGLQQALRAAKAGRFDILLVYRVDRFSRRLSDLLDLLGELDDAGVAFASATEPFDTSTSIGRMLVPLLGVFAEFERETIIDRVTNGMATKASKGKWPGGTPPTATTLTAKHRNSSRTRKKHRTCGKSSGFTSKNATAPEPSPTNSTAAGCPTARANPGPGTP